MIGAQHRLDEPVREPEHEDVLHRLLAEEVVDAEDLVFAPAPVQLLVERERGREIGAERLLDHQPAPTVRLVGEPGLGDGLGRVGEHARRQREVEDRGTVEHVLEHAQRCDRQVAAVELDAFDEPVEVLGVVLGAGKVERGAQVLVELIVGPVLARVTDDPQILEPFAVLERQQRGEQQPGREVSRRTEDDERGLVTHAAAFLSLLVRLHVAGHVAEQAGVEDALGEPPRAVDALEPVVVLAGQDRVQPLTGDLEHREAAARRSRSHRRPAPSRS